MKLSPALCLDFDGTIRRSKSGQQFIQSPEDIELMPGMERRIWHYRNMGWLILGISNQAGVAHGYKTLTDVDVEMSVTISLFSRNPFHFIKFCVHHELGNREPFNHRSICRKPDIGMLAFLEKDCYNKGFIVDWDNSLFVGDRNEDEECAKNARIPFKHVQAFLNEPITFTIGE